MAAKIINTAISDWSSNPTITSLDSIATPIDEVQFPTLTVCDDNADLVQDNWAFIKSLFNFLDYKCLSPSDSIKYDRYCDRTENLRKDFNFLIESIVDAFLSPLLLNENLNHSLTFLRPGGKIHSKTFLSPSGNQRNEYSRLLRKAIDVVSSGNMSLKDLKELPIEYFSKGLSNREVSLISFCYYIHYLRHFKIHAAGI